MIDLQSRAKPDILEVIADLSSDEVFTPPRVVNRILDLLPEAVWADPSLRWVDPGSKTGVFLREAARRLMVGLEAEFPAAQERLDHILHNMLHGIAITELTALMSRRTLYCSKDAGGDRSASHLPTAAGNIWMERVEHTYSDGGRCMECGASSNQMEREDRDNYAYAFIHADGVSKLEEEFDMKFDVIVGNPPYQMDSDGGTRTMPIYNLFVDQAKALAPKYIAMVTPSRWMAGGLGLDQFRKSMLEDARIRKLVIFPDAGDVFPGVQIKGGVCYFLWDRDNEGSCAVSLQRGSDVHGPILRALDQHDVFVRDSRAIDVLETVRAREEPPITEIMGTNNEFAIGTNYTGYLKERRPGSIALHIIEGGRREKKWMKRSDVPRGQHLIDKWKVLIPKSYGAGEDVPHQILGVPIVAEPPSVSTQTYVVVFAEDESSAQSIESYMRTRFFRFLVSLRKISQHAPKQTYLWVPQQAWNRAWTDADLFKKYGIAEDQQTYIAEMVKEMPA